MRIAVVEDAASDRELIIRYLNRFENENKTSLEPVCFSDGREFVEQYDGQFDLILMDIELPEMDGMTAAGRIREMDKDVIIIFITNSPQYAIQGYKVEAIDYLLKPLAWYAFSEALKRALSHLSGRERSFINVRVKNGSVRLATDQICYIEIFNHELCYHTKDGEIRTNATMREVAEKLAGQPFFQCSKSVLINFAFVEGMVGNDIKVAGTVIQVSRARRKSLIEALNAYFDGVPV